MVRVSRDEAQIWNRVWNRYLALVMGEYAAAGRRKPEFCGIWRGATLRNVYVDGLSLLAGPEKYAVPANRKETRQCLVPHPPRTRRGDERSRRETA